MNARLQTTAMETFVLNEHLALGDIAAHLPGATAIFRQLKMDFCCGGQISLAQAASDKSLDVQAILQTLAGLQRDEGPAEFADAGALIDHILERYHAVHREQLPELIRMARRVEAVHRDHPEVPAGLASLLETMELELLNHMAKEESILFPTLKAGGNPFVQQPIKVMRSEHTSHGAMLERLLTTSHGAQPPQGACNTWRALYAGIAQLHDDLTEHIHLENNVLFPLFEARNAAQGHSPCCGSCG